MKIDKDGSTNSKIIRISLDGGNCWTVVMKFQSKEDAEMAFMQILIGYEFIHRQNYSDINEG